MIQIRRNVFETNSSSTHSITIGDRAISSPDLCYDEESRSVKIFLEEFCSYGLGSQNARAAFLIENIIFTHFGGNALWCGNAARHHSIKEKLKEIEEYRRVEETIINYMKANGYPECECVEIVGEGYIDHDSVYSDIDDLLSTFDLSVEEWIFAKDIYILFEFRG